MQNFKNLNLNDVTIMSESEMKKVSGGGKPLAFQNANDQGSYRCCCGMGATNDCFDVPASSSLEASEYVFDRCTDGIGGCFIP